MRLKILNESGGPDPWYAEGLAFSCTQCGNCCTGAPGYVWLSDVEAQRLADFLKLGLAETVKRYCRTIGGRLSLKERFNRGSYDCVFLKEERRTDAEGRVNLHRTCTVYEVRPLQCRTWPFWDGLLASPENWEAGTRKCPGMNHGKRYALAEIEALRTAEDWPGR